MLLSTSSSERTIPARRWGRAAALAAGCLLLFLGSWETYWRGRGYTPSYNSSEGLWAFQRERVAPDDVVIIGDSRTRYDLDPGVWEKETGGRRPVLLGIDGSSARPVLSDLAADPLFKGTVVCNVCEGLFFAPGGPPLQRATERISYYRKRTLSQIAGDYLAMELESRFVFLQKEDLSLSSLLNRLPVPPRTGAFVPPKLPPQLGVVHADNRSVMLSRLETDQVFQKHVKDVWLGILAVSPPVEPKVRDGILDSVCKDVEQIRSRGGDVVFLRLPSTSEYLEIEKKKWPRDDHWKRLLERSGAAGFHFEDHPGLQGFDCPEWSHLTRDGAALFTERLVRIMREAGVNLSRR